MTPLAVNPNVLVLIKDGKIVKQATNVASDLAVTVTNDPAEFADKVRGITFVTEVK